MTPILNIARLRAVLALRGLTMRKLASVAGVHYLHLYRGLTGERALSQGVLDSVRASIGDDGWAFARGDSYVLVAPFCPPGAARGP